MNKKPYLSIVVVSRNDNRERSFHTRMQMFLKILFGQLHGRSFLTELIIVEWNPPQKQKPLDQVLNFRDRPDECVVRIITVPPKYHNNFPNSSKIGLFQFIAKNVGLVRARAQFVLATNIDILFSKEIIDSISKKNLDKNEMVRAVRYDVSDTITLDKSSEDILEKCKGRVIRAFFPWGTDTYKSQPTFLQRLLYRYKLSNYQGVFANACGDFTLLPKKWWERLRGYPQYPYHGVKIDGLLCHAAAVASIRQRILPINECIYHIDHPDSWIPRLKGELTKRLIKRGIPFMATEHYNREIEKMIAHGKPPVWNTSDWGLKKEQFIERLYK